MRTERSAKNKILRRMLASAALACCAFLGAVLCSAEAPAHTYTESGSTAWVDGVAYPKLADFNDANNNLNQPLLRPYTANTDLYIVEVGTSAATNYGRGMAMNLCYIVNDGGTRKVQWTNPMDVRGKAERYKLSSSVPFSAGDVDYITVQLPKNTEEIIAVSFYKIEAVAWAPSYVKVSKATQTVSGNDYIASGVAVIGLGQRTRAFSGVCVAGTARAVNGLQDSSGAGWQRIYMEQPQNTANADSGKVQGYAVDFSVGEIGTSYGGWLRVKYADSVGAVHTLERNISEWNSLTANTASGHVLRSYSLTSFFFQAQDLQKIVSVELNLEGTDVMQCQITGLRVLRLSSGFSMVQQSAYSSQKNYYVYQPSYAGDVIATLSTERVNEGSPYRMDHAGYHFFGQDSIFAKPGTQNRLEIPATPFHVDNTAQQRGIGIQVRDEWDAALDNATLSGSSYDSVLLEVKYKDTYGLHRVVRLPVVSMLHQFYIGDKETHYNLLQPDSLDGFMAQFTGLDAFESCRFVMGYRNNATPAAERDAVVMQANYDLNSSLSANGYSFICDAVIVYDSVQAQFKSAESCYALVPGTSQFICEPAGGFNLSGGTGVTKTEWAAMAASGGRVYDRDYSNSYVLSFTTSANSGGIIDAGTDEPIALELNYVDTEGLSHVLSFPDVRKKVRDFTNSEQTAFYNGCVDSFRFTADKVDHFVSAKVTLGSGTESIDSWQFENLTITKVQTLAKRSFENYYWRRAFTGQKVAVYTKPVLLQKGFVTRTLNFTSFGQDAPAVDLPVTDDALTKLPSTMTFDQANKDLGLSRVKATYRVEVKVADLEDAGSTNHFFFQLLFENGKSGVVLANQQLQSDQFRAGVTETFSIVCNQDYGQLKAVRIICERSSTQTNVFDKLCVDSIHVSMVSTTAFNRSWTISPVQWIDIEYQDEGTDDATDATRETLKGTGAEVNSKIVKEYAITGYETNVNLLFRLQLAQGTDRNFAGGVQAVLHYTDSKGIARTQNFALNDAIKNFSGSSDVSSYYPRGQTASFLLPISDLRTLQSISFSTSGDSIGFGVDSITAKMYYTIDDYAYMTGAGYQRDMTGPAEPLTTTENSMYLSGNGGGTMYFKYNEITLPGFNDLENKYIVSKYPESTDEALDIYVYPTQTWLSEHTTRECLVEFAAQYVTAGSGGTVQVSQSIGASSDTYWMLKGLKVKDFSSFSRVVLGINAVQRPSIDHVIIHRTSGSTLIGTYTFDFGGQTLTPEGVGVTPAQTLDIGNMEQVLEFSVPESQAPVLVNGNRQVAAALLYTSSIDPSDTVFCSPYVYLSEQGVTSLSSKQSVQVLFHQANVRSIVGLRLIGYGENFTVNALAMSNFSATLDASSETGYARGSFLSGASVGTPVSVTNRLANIEVTGEADTAKVLSLVFNTSPEDTHAAAGTSEPIRAVLRYKTPAGLEQSLTLENLRNFVTAEDAFTSGSKTTVRLVLPNVQEITGISLQLMGTAENIELWHPASIESYLVNADSTVSSRSCVCPSDVWVNRLQERTYSLVPSYNSSTAEPEVTDPAAPVVYKVTVNGTELYDLSALAGAQVALPAPEVHTDLASGKAVKWAVNDNLAVNADGTAVFTVPQDAEAGKIYTLVVASAVDATKSATVRITVQAAPAPTP